jgi:hypothetical protein
MLFQNSQSNEAGVERERGGNRPQNRGGGRTFGTKSGGFRQSRSGQQGPRSRGRFPGRRWGWLYRGPWGVPAVSAPDENVLQAQSCLARLIGPWIPQQGVMGPATRRGIRMFQQRQSLPVTGLLDAATTSALQNACAGPEGPPPSPADAPPPAEEPAAADTGAPDSPEGEFYAGTQQELVVQGTCRIELNYHPAVPLKTSADLKKTLAGPGVYIIFSEGKPWYVGMAANQIRDRFLARLKTLRDFNIPENVVAGRSVAFATLKTISAPSCTISQRAGGGKTAARKLPGAAALLRIVEQFFIKRLKTNMPGRGNERGEAVIVEGNQPITIVVRNAADGKVKTLSFPPSAVQAGAGPKR